MAFLLDTHTFLWFITDSPMLSEVAKKLIGKEENAIYVSIASCWEISIKNSIGKLDLQDGYEDIARQIIDNEFNLLNINFEHTLLVNKLPLHHRDPFDRMLLAQAISEGLDIIGTDTIFDSYLANTQVKRIW